MAEVVELSDDGEPSSKRSCRSRSSSERSVSLHKAAGERTLIGLQQRKGGTVCISSVAYDSPLAGNVHPCDIITAINGAPVRPPDYI